MARGDDLNLQPPGYAHDVQRGTTSEDSERHEPRHYAGKVVPKHRRQEFLAFLRQFNRTYPDQDLHLVMDNYAKIRQFITGWNDRTPPFFWTKTPEQILAKANPQATSETRHYWGPRPS